MMIDATMELIYNKGERFSDFIENNMSLILQEWSRTGGKNKFFQSAKATPNSLRESFENLFLIIGQDFPGIQEHLLIEWAQDIGRKRAKTDFPVHYSLELFYEFRNIFWRTLHFYLIHSKEHLDAKEVFTLERYYNNAIDKVIYHFSSNYVMQKNELIRFQQITMEELSVPIIPLTDNACILAVVGVLDHHRANKMMEQTFGYVKELKMKFLILDITAANFIESAAASDIIKMLQGLKLLGCDSVMTGIKPDVAKMMVELGGDVTERITSKTTIKEAIESLNLLRNPASDGCRPCQPRRVHRIKKGSRK